MSTGKSNQITITNVRIRSSVTFGIGANDILVFSEQGKATDLLNLVTVLNEEDRLSQSEIAERVADITADNPAEMVARGDCFLPQFGPLPEDCAFLADGNVDGGTAFSVARRKFPKQFLHHHRAGHGAISRGYTA